MSLIFNHAIWETIVNCCKSIIFFDSVEVLYFHVHDAEQNPLKIWIEIKAFSFKWKTPADINIGL